MKVLRKLDDMQRGHPKGSILSRRLGRGSSQRRLPLPARGVSGEGGRASLRAHRSSYYFVLVVPPLYLSLSLFSTLSTPVSWRRTRWVLSYFLPICCSHFPWDAGKHLRGAEMKSYPLASRRRFRALPQHLDSSSTRKAWGNLALAFIMQSQPFPRGIVFSSVESWRIIRGVYAPLKWV